MRRIALFIAAGLAALAVSGAASAQSISVGQTVRGEIRASDAVADDDSRYDCWTFRAPAGNYTVDYRSDAFDAYLVVGKGSDCTVEGSAVNDDGDDGLDSHLEFATDGGVWFIKANTLEAGETGPYSLSLVAGGDPTRDVTDGDRDDGDLDLAWLEDLAARPGGDAHLMNVLCTAVDTLDLISTMEGMTDEQVQARVTEGARFSEAANRTGAGLGFTQEQVENQVAELAVTLMLDPESDGDFSGARQECMAMN